MPRRTDRIFLTGFMGCGKSTIAPLLAGDLGLDYFDIDGEIERQTGKSVSGIFGLEGEAYFRRVERGILFGLAERSSVVVALGGGTIANEENFAFVKSAGLLVWLRVDFETLFARLKTKTDRPLLARGMEGESGEEQLRESMRRLLAEREPFYRRADLVCTPGSEEPATTAARLAAGVRALPGTAGS